MEGSGVSLRLLQLLSATPDACAGSGGVCARVCEMWIVAGLLLLVGKCALCAALRWRAMRACCARVRVGIARASACAARAPACAVRCALLCACLCSFEAQAWLAGLRGGLRRAVGGRAPA